MNKKILALDNTTGSKLWRIEPHLRRMQSLGCEVKQVGGKGRVDLRALLADVLWCDVVLFQSVFDNTVADFAKKHNKKIVFEFDDLIDEVPETHPMAKQVNTKEWADQVYKVIGMSDLVITTNSNLKARFEHLNKNIQIFPNYMDISFWERPYNPNTNTDQIRLGWAGGISHQNDLEWISPVVADILKKYPQVKFIYCGDGGSYKASKLTSFNYGEDHFAEIPANRREFVMGSKLEHYPDKLNSLQLDIAIAPLVDNTFARCKTPIKWMEYAINRVPCIGQDFMYSQVIDHGRNGLVASDKDSWFSQIELLVNNLELRLELANEAYNDVHEKHDIDRHLDRWVSIFSSVF